jgi:predicted O-methyltransferase YrrM
MERAMASQNAGKPNFTKRTLEEILKIIEAIPENMCGAPQPRFLFDLSLKCKGAGAVVEIGTAAGKSTIALAYAQQTRGGAPINTIDIVEHAEIEANLSRANVTAFVNRIVRSSSDVAASWSDPIELLWIDGDHSFKGVSKDIECWAEKVLPGGFMAFHDYPSQGGKVLGSVGRAVYAKVLSRPDLWRIVADRQAGSILAFERMQPIGQTEPGYAANRFKKAVFFLTGIHRRVAKKMSRTHQV